MDGLKGLAGVFYFPNGWVGKPWDNYFKIQYVKIDENVINLSGNGWSLIGSVNSVDKFEDTILFDFEDFNVKFNDEVIKGQNNTGSVLFYFGDSYDSLEAKRDELITQRNLGHSINLIANAKR